MKIYHNEITKYSIKIDVTNEIDWMTCGLPFVVVSGIGLISLLHNFVSQTHSSTVYSFPSYINLCSEQ